VVRVLPNLVREINPWRDALALLQLARLLRRDRFDVVHTHSSKAGILGRAAAKLARVPHVVHTVHGWGFHDRMHPRLKQMYVVLERMLEPSTSALVSVSNKTTRIGLEEGIGSPPDYRLIRSGIPLGRFSPDRGRGAEIRRRLGIAADDIVVGSVGRLSPQKNPHDFVSVAELLSRGRTGLRFVYVGDGPMRGEVEGAIESAGLSDRVLLLGVRDDVPDLLRAVDIFILTSLWEGLPRVVLQALATGVPVVAYDTAGIKEAVREGANGHLVAPGDVDGMVSKLGPLVDDPELRDRLSANAAGGFEASFTEETMIRDLEDLYAGLTEPGGGRV
jgi:glycosyltransferase involved in cell wall biosynthesis